jgi:hypothetical protein
MDHMLVTHSTFAALFAFGASPLCITIFALSKHTFVNFTIRLDGCFALEHVTATVNRDLAATC